MSSSRAVAKVTADWSKLATKVHRTEVPKLNKFKSRVDASAVKLASLPDSLPKIDWDYYKANASDAKIVEEIQKKYSSLKIDVPKAPESRLAELKQAQLDDERRYKAFAEVAKSYIDSSEVVKTKFKNMLPFREMTLEDWALTFPEWTNHSIENPVMGSYSRFAGLTREEAAAFDQPDPVPFSTKTAWKEWEIRKKKFYSD